MQICDISNIIKFKMLNKKLCDNCGQIHFPPKWIKCNNKLDQTMDSQVKRSVNKFIKSDKSPIFDDSFSDEVSTASTDEGKTVQLQILQGLK